MDLANPRTVENITTWWLSDKRDITGRMRHRALCSGIPMHLCGLVQSWCYDIALYVHLREVGGEHTPEWYTEEIESLLERIRAVEGRERLRSEQYFKLTGELLTY